MIKIDENTTIISGELTTLLTQTTMLLNKLYQEMKNSIGEEQANQYMVEMGRLAIMSEDELHTHNMDSWN